MRKFVLTGLVAATAAFALVAYAQDIPETAVIDGCADAKAPVEFPHKAHLEVTDCTTCHHKSEGLTLETAASMEVKTCVSCHGEPEDAETPLCSAKSLKKNPYHITCVGCHKTMKKEAKAAGTEFGAPTKCTACHPKAE
ncbi:MAG: cytochrome c3 family protein [bacterium]|nr:cytochrome c3 family protein [bacterium]